MDWGLPGSSVHGILQAGMLEWVAIPFSRGSSQPRDQTQVSCTVSKFFATWTTGKAPYIYQVPSTAGASNSPLLKSIEYNSSLPLCWNLGKKDEWDTVLFFLQGITMSLRKQVNKCGNHFIYKQEWKKLLAAF